MPTTQNLTPPWKDYQREVADFFRELGLTAYEDAQVQGVRTNHIIDVFIVFEFFGIVTRWIVECKHWTRRIPKERVFALRSIADDIGADRAFLVSQRGFQVGALAAATATNVELVTLSDLRERAGSGLRELKLRQVDDRARDVIFRIRDLSVWKRTPDGGWSRTKPGVTAGRRLTSWVGSCSFIRSGVDHLRHLGAGPVVLPALDAELSEGPRVTTDPDEFLQKSIAVLDELDSLVMDQEARVADAQHAPTTATPPHPAGDSVKPPVG